MKQKIKSVIVVEGKTDTNKLKSLFDVDTIETNGSALSNETINLIKSVSKEREIILFLDPDGPGENIRRILQSKLVNFKQAFIKKTDINSNSHKIGIAEATSDSIKNALFNAIDFSNLNESISWAEYLSFNLDSKIKRLVVTNVLKISPCNHKQLFKRLNMMNIKFTELKKIINEN